MPRSKSSLTTYWPKPRVKRLDEYQVSTEQGLNTYTIQVKTPIFRLHRTESIRPQPLLFNHDYIFSGPSLNVGEYASGNTLVPNTVPAPGLNSGQNAVFNNQGRYAITRTSVC